MKALPSATIVSLTAIAGLLAQPKPAPTRLEEHHPVADNIREAVFRRMFEDNAPEEGAKQRRFFLAIVENDKPGDPSDDFMKRFARDKLPPKKFSQCTLAGQGVHDKETGEEGMVCWVGTIRWKKNGADEVEVAAHDSLPKTRPAGDTFFLRRGKERAWEVDQRLSLEYTESESPDGRFGVQYHRKPMLDQKGDIIGAEVIGMQLVELQTNRVLLKLKVENYRQGNTLVPLVKFYWAPDSQRLAMNCSYGTRYDDTELYQWNGKRFTALAKPAEMIDAVIEQEIRGQRKAHGIADDVAEVRRIRDFRATKRWLDERTIELVARSQRAVQVEQSPDLDAYFRFILKLDDRGKWKTLKQEKVSPDQNEEEQW